MTSYPAFKPIPRWDRECVITEKIDGTNGLISISDGSENNGEPWIQAGAPDGVLYLAAGSRNRWLTPEQDNFGFARWAWDNADTLVSDLGPGLHYGEWWGRGIQRGYGMGEKLFSLFNVSRWTDAEFTTDRLRVVPTLMPEVQARDLNLFGLGALRELQTHGSVAAPGFMAPEGIVIYHRVSNSLFKWTIGDDGHKSASVKR